MRHAHYYADFVAEAAENSYGPEQLTWTRRIDIDRQNIRAALATAIDTGDAALAVRLVADHPHGQSHAVAPAGELLSMDEAISHAIGSVDPRILTGPIEVE